MANYTIARPATREAWLKLRKSGIGSSEAGIIAGVSRFKTPIGLYMEKKGLAPHTEETPVMKAGHEFEPIVAYMYAQRTGDVMDPRSEGDWLAIDNDRPWLRVSPDRLFWSSALPAASRDTQHAYIVECKTTTLKVTPEDYPKSWFFQVQYQMGVMGIKKAVIAWISSSPFLNFGFVEVPFNKAVFDELVAMISDFWNNNVIAGRMPERVLTNEDASHMWPEAFRETVSVASDDLVALVMKYNVLSSKSGEMDKEMDDIKLKVKTYMGSTEELRTPDGKTIATWKQNKTGENQTPAQAGRRLSFKKIFARS